MCVPKYVSASQKPLLGPVGCSSLSILWLSAALGSNEGEEQAGGVGRDLLPHFLLSAFLNYSEEPFGASLVPFGEMECQEA